MDYRQATVNSSCPYLGAKEVLGEKVNLSNQNPTHEVDGFHE